MSFRREEFREWFSGTGKTPGTVSSYISWLNGVDVAFDLDTKLNALGTDAFLEWVKNESSGPFERNPIQTRTSLKRYVEFSINARSPDQSSVVEDDDEATEQPLLFRLEREMQVAVRRQLDELESGLVECDDGVERTVATGKIDIVARDQQGGLVVIELKSGLCPPPALEQVLGYADALAEETGEVVRAYLIAGEFTDRTRAAARRTNDLKLRSYEFKVRFNTISE